MTPPNGKAEPVAGLAEVHRVLAANASPMTGPGTWTHLVGHRDIVIIDPGPDDRTHLRAILQSLPTSARVAAIVVTHAHKDHSGLAPALSRATGAEILAFGAPGEGRSPAMTRLAESGLVAGGEGIDHGFRPDRTLVDGDVLETNDCRLEVLHTPGHMAGHLCLALGDVLFTGDHVMGWAPSLISPPDGDMGAYMASLERLRTRDWRKFVPAHGDPIDDPKGRTEALIAHRRDREARILAALRDEHQATLGRITERAYAGTDPGLLKAASRNALAHLIDLAERNLAVAFPRPGIEAIWQAV